MRLCRGQGYDGAGNMSGKYIGASTLIKIQFPLAIYTHCCSHRLNLCLSTSCQMQLVRNMLGTLEKAILFFENSQKRLNQLKKDVKEVLGDNHPEINLIMLCLTRWIEKIDSMHRFREAFSAVMKTYDTIQLNSDKNWNSASCVDAQGLYRACGNFEFIMVLVIVERVFSVTRDATVLLQDREIDLFTAYREVKNVRAALKKIRDNVDQHHAKWFNEAKKMAKDVAVSPTKRRICNIQRNRENYDTPDCETYYRCAATIPFLDHVIHQIDERFNATTEPVVVGFVLIPT